jgi:hypothetical protein
LRVWLCGCVGAASSEQQRREDDAPTDRFHGAAVVGSGVLEGVAVAGTGVEVKMTVDVDVEKSGVFVDVLVGVGVLVAVIVIAGVLVGTLGTQSTWPTWMMVELPMQLADCNRETVVLYNSEIRNKFSPVLTT